MYSTQEILNHTSESIKGLEIDTVLSNALFDKVNSLLNPLCSYMGKEFNHVMSVIDLSEIGSQYDIVVYCEQILAKFRKSQYTELESFWDSIHDMETFYFVI